MDILNKIQQNLTVPKSQYNKFGNYSYRSCEDILEAVKPLLGDAVLTISDEIVQVGERYYVKAAVTLKQDKDVYVSVSAFAREALTKKGMDESQITGAASSYARKYALNGLFCIDDTKDADHATDEKPKAAAAPKAKAKPKPDGKAVMEIIDQAFFEFTTINKDALAEGFEFNKDKFIIAIKKEFGRLPADTTKKAEAVKVICEKLKPADGIIESKENQDA